MNTPTHSKDPAANLAARQRWVTPAAQVKAQQAITSAVDALGGPPLRHALHGDWLHEPLHAVLTDIPVGSWTATVAFDALAALSSSNQLDTAADATLILGLLGATGSAITGLNDWSSVHQPVARRVGAVHGILNLAATGLFLASACSRRRKNRNTGRALAMLGYLTVSAAAHLGGNLVYEHRVGSHEAREAARQPFQAHPDPMEAEGAFPISLD